MHKKHTIHEGEAMNGKVLDLIRKTAEQKCLAFGISPDTSATAGQLAEDNYRRNQTHHEAVEAAVKWAKSTSKNKGQRR